METDNLVRLKQPESSDEVFTFIDTQLLADIFRPFQYTTHAYVNNSCRQIWLGVIDMEYITVYYHSIICSSLIVSTNVYVTDLSITKYISSSLSSFSNLRRR